MEETIEEWYQKMRIRYDGSQYIGTPYIPNTSRRRKTKHESITVFEKDGKLKLEEQKHYAWQDKLIEDDSLELPEEWAYLESMPIKDFTPPARTTTRKQIFEELYAKYLSLNRKERREAIYNDMLPLFKTDIACAEFVDGNLERKKRNDIERKKRFVRKVLNMHPNYFVTFTYSDEKHTEESFKKSLSRTLRNFAGRKGWQYAGTWERGKKTDRLHYHGLFFIPDGTLSGEWVEVKDYNYKKGIRKVVKMNSFFLERYGRNEFEVLDKGPLLGHAIGYILKYINKSGERLVMSRHLPQQYVADVEGKDVICKLNPDNEMDGRVILNPKTTLWDEGVKVGEICEETLKQLPKII